MVVEVTVKDTVRPDQPGLRVGARVLHERQRRGITRKVLAGESGLSTSYLQNLEGGGVKYPTPATVDALARALDVPADYLLSKMDGVETELVEAAQSVVELARRARQVLPPDRADALIADVMRALRDAAS